MIMQWPRKQGDIFTQNSMLLSPPLFPSRNANVPSKWLPRPLHDNAKCIEISLSCAVSRERDDNNNGVMGASIIIMKEGECIIRWYG